MRSINEGEVKRLKQWAIKENNREYFERHSSDSFWIDRKSDATYIKEYSFETVPEFEALCTDILGHELDAAIKKAVSVAVIKNVPIEEDYKADIDDDEKLPEYNYVF